MSHNNKKRFANFSTNTLDFDDLLAIQSDFKTLFASVKKHRPDCTTFLINGRELVKDAKRGIDNLVNYRITTEKLGQHITKALEKLNLLYGYVRMPEQLPEYLLSKYDQRNQNLRQLLSNLIHKLGVLLPIDFGVQLQLFDDAEYHDPNARRVCFPGFRDWAYRKTMSAKIKAGQKHHELYVRYQSNKFLFTPPKQLSIRLFQPPCPQKLKTLTLRQARKVASFLGLPQKQNGKDLSLSTLIADFQSLWSQSPQGIHRRFNQVLATL